MVGAGLAPPDGAKSGKLAGADRARQELRVVKRETIVRTVAVDRCDAFR